VWRNFRHGRPPKLSDKEGKPMLNRALLEKTYLNPEWLKKRRFVEGEVRVPTCGVAFQGDWNAGMRGLGDAWIAANQANKKIAGGYYERVKPSFEFVSKYRYNDPETLKAFVEARDLSYTAPKFAVFGGKLALPPSVAPLPSLPAEQCSKLTAAIVYMCSAFFDNYGFHAEWAKHFDTTLNRRWYLYSVDGAKVLSEASYQNDAANKQLCFKLINDVADFTNRFSDDYYGRKCIGYDAFDAWLRGAIAWIDASVK